jgi:hypothetical protein
MSQKVYQRKRLMTQCMQRITAMFRIAVWITVGNFSSRKCLAIKRSGQ